MPKIYKYESGDLIGPHNIKFIKEVEPKIKPSGRKERKGLFICPHCGSYFECYIYNIRSGKTQSCGCYQKQVVSERSQKDISGQRFGKLVALRPTNQRIDQKVVWECECDCGQTVYAPINVLTRGDKNSCGCFKGSIGEEKIRQILISLNIDFEKEKRFADCKDKRTLPFDFYLPQHNCCIEYDGEQHFYTTGGWNNKQHLENVQKRDKIKTDYCLSKNIKLIRIPYTDLDIIDEQYILSKL